MSNDDNSGFKNVDNLTPFEYALAGVPVPESQDSPSLMVIEQMRRLAEEVDDAPISQPRLREFLTTGGSIAKRNDRRSLRRRRPQSGSSLSDLPDGGGFVDITPIELTGGVEPGAEPGVGAGAGAAAAGAFVAGRLFGDEVSAGGNQLEQPDPVEIDGGDMAGADAPGAAESAPDDFDIVHASLQDELDDQTQPLDIEHLAGPVDPAEGPLFRHESGSLETEFQDGAAARDESGIPGGTAAPADAEALGQTDAEDDAGFLAQTGFADEAGLVGDAGLPPEPEFSAETGLSAETGFPAEPGLSAETGFPAEPGFPDEAEVHDRIGARDGADALDEIGALDGSDAPDPVEALNQIEALDWTEALGRTDALDGSAALSGTEAVAGSAALGGTEALKGSEAVAGFEALNGFEAPGGTDAVDGIDALDGTEPLDAALLSGDGERPDPHSGDFDSMLDELLGSEDRDTVAAAGPLLFGADDPAEAAASDDHLADIAPPQLPDPRDDGGERSDDDGAILVPASGGAQMSGILGGSDGYADQGEVAQLAAVTSNVPVPGRRLGGAMWALAGSAAAAAALVVGGLWWTNNLSNQTETESAEAPLADDSGVDGADGSATEAGDGQGAGGESSDAQGSSDSDESSQTTEFGSRDSSTTTSALEADGSTTTVRRTSSTRRQTTAGSATGSSTSQTTDRTASTEARTPSTEPSSTDSVTTAQNPETTLTPTTAGRPSVTRPSETTRRTTNTTSAPPALAFIGDSVTIGSFNGPGASGVLVELYRDPSQTGTEANPLASRVTSSDGSYGFNIEAGCYVIRFYPPDGFEFRDGQARQTTCVDPGGAVGRIDAVAYPIARPAGPSGCKVEPKGNQDYRGVEVYENSGNWAESYTFYGNTGGVIVRTRDLGPADDVEGPTNREWESVANGFNHRNVYSVAAERGGVESDPVPCFRESKDND